MAENTQSAKCSQSEYEAARRAGLLVFTTADEIAIHKFAKEIRESAYAEGYAAAIEFIASGESTDAC